MTKNRFRRGYEAKYDKVQQLQEIKGSSVVAQDGSTVNIKLVAAVPSSSGQPENTTEENQRQQKKRDALYEMMEIISEFLQGREISLRSVALHLARQRFEINGRQVTYKELLRSQSLLGFGALADGIRLFPEMLKLTRNGFFVKRA